MSENLESSEKPRKNLLRGAIDGVPFSADHQPTGEQKSAGWAKKRKGQELVKFIMEQPFIGTEDGVLKKQMAAYFGCDEGEITNEMAMLFRQAQKAITESDTQAFKAVHERGYGMPSQPIDLTDKKKYTVTLKK